MLERVRVHPDSAVNLDAFPTDERFDLDQDEAAEELDHLQNRLAELGGLIEATRERAVLVVFQGMDASGKDGSIKHCIGPLNPSIVQVASFKVPTQEELDHDFLWRAHRSCPRRGTFGVFNRSHYEDVLVVRVEDLVPKKRWSTRYDAINAFEKTLSDEGTVILKFFLHLSRDKQGKELQERLDERQKHWKFDAGDLAKRAKWDDYMEAYRVMLERTSTEWAPWYVVPSDRSWIRNLVITRALVAELEKLDMEWPQLAPDDRGLSVT